MEDTDKHWRLWGELDPYRGVCYPEGLAAEFWESGESYITRLLDAIGPIARSSALDFGCGVGRILRPLSMQFEHITGVDISPAMLEHARSNVPGAELLGRIPITGQFDLVHSCLVLQHIPVKRGLEIIKQLRACVAAGGVLALQVPTEVQHSWAYRIKHSMPAARFLFNALQGKPLREPLMQMNAYPVEAISETLGESEQWTIADSKGLIFLCRPGTQVARDAKHQSTQITENNGAVERD
jgi:trans-aconitate methyltransferase